MSAFDDMAAYTQQNFIVIYFESDPLVHDFEPEDWVIQSLQFLVIPVEEPMEMFRKMLDIFYNFFIV